MKIEGVKNILAGFVYVAMIAIVGTGMVTSVQPMFV